VEDADTLEANARLKAVAVSEGADAAAVADDTGLEVDALGGAPGVLSARFAGEGATYADNVLKLLDALVELPEMDQRTAQFRTVALVRFPDGREITASGSVSGIITPGPRGTGGFGYDQVFQPDEGDGRTFAEMSAEEKHAISHRGRAFRALAQLLS
jgi:XTP/dITP diphosphohydrolase